MSTISNTDSFFDKQFSRHEEDLENFSNHHPILVQSHQHSL